MLPPLGEPTTRPAPLPYPSGPVTAPPAVPPRDTNAPAAPVVDPNRRPTGPGVEPPAPVGAKPGDSTLPRPAEPAKPAAPPAGAKTHKVAAGESLWVIAEDYYGDGHLWKRIRDANPGIDENKLQEGQVLVIPPKEGAAKPAAPTTPPAPPATPPGAAAKPADPNKPADSAAKPKARKATYRVEAGDTLVSIARAILKDGERWREIYELNKDRIKDPDRLLVGTELKLPE
jgi:nucleoid-associated protein YgaU